MQTILPVDIHCPKSAHLAEKLVKRSIAGRPPAILRYHSTDSTDAGAEDWTWLPTHLLLTYPVRTTSYQMTSDEEREP